MIGCTLSSQFLQYVQLPGVCYSQVPWQLTGDIPPQLPFLLLMKETPDWFWLHFGAIFNWVSCWLDSHRVFLLPSSIKKGKWVENKLIMPYSIQLLVVLGKCRKPRRKGRGTVCGDFESTGLWVYKFLQSLPEWDGCFAGSQKMIFSLWKHGCQVLYSDMSNDWSLLFPN